MRQKIITTFLLLVMFSVLSAIFVEEISALPGISYPPPHTVNLQPNFMPPPSPNLFVQYKWTPDDVVKAILANGIEIKKTGPVTEADYSSLPAKAKEAIRFTSPSIEEYAVGCILTFEQIDDMDKIIDHYRGLNNKGELYSWTFVKDNALIVLNGLISEEKARTYESALKILGEK